MLYTSVLVSKSPFSDTLFFHPFFNTDKGLHALVYDINTGNETWEWVNLKEVIMISVFLLVFLTFDGRTEDDAAS